MAAAGGQGRGDGVGRDRGRGADRRGRAGRGAPGSRSKATTAGRRAGDRGTVEIRARYTVVADGANSRFGRSLGTSRNRAYPLGMAIRGYWTSPRHDEPWIDSWLDIRDKAGNVLPGYGWIFPVGDGRINVGHRPALHLQPVEGRQHHPPAAELRRVRPARRGTSAPRRPAGRPTGGRLPMGLSVGPHAGPTWLVVGDAGGTINPFNGEGIAYAYESGRMAADAVHLALASGRRDGPADLPEPPRRRRTACTTRWPGPSCGSSAGPS